MKKLFTLLTFVLFVATASSQWVSRTAFPGIARAKATAFTIGTKIYVLGGVNNFGNVLNDFWEYDIPTNSWLQNPNFPGPERYGATAFVMNGKGYIATGGNDNGYLDDLWEYNPATAMWIQRTGLPAGSAQHENQRVEAYSFVIGNKAYLGGGSGFVFGANQTSNIAFPDLWEYDPSAGTWTPKADIPDFLGRNMSIGVAINNKGYAGLGCNVDQTVNHQSFWQYDPLTNTWTAMANIPSNFTADAGAFVLNSNLYLTGGVNLNPLGLSSQFYRYDPVANTWTSMPAFNGGAIAGEFTVSTGSTAFAGGGYTASITTRNDLWQYTAAVTGIEEPNLTEGISLYPNPARDVLTISSVKEILSVEIFDVSGKLTLRAGNVKILPVTILTAGLYQVKFVFRDGSIANKLFVKAN
jgi:N-acetylneuraminic acid mutarotase